MVQKDWGVRAAAIARQRPLPWRCLAGVRSILWFRALGLGPKAWYARVVQKQTRLAREQRYRGVCHGGRRQNAGNRRPDAMNLHSLQGPVQQNQEAKVTLTEGSRQAGTWRRGDFGGVWRRGRPVLVGVDVGVLSGRPGTSVSGARGR
jgi:hypothetical protein